MDSFIQEILNKTWKEIRSHINTTITHSNTVDSEAGCWCEFTCSNDGREIFVTMLNGNVIDLNVQ